MLPESFRVQFRGCLCKTERSQAQQREREREREWEIGLGQADIFGYIDCNESVSMHDQGTDLPAIPGSKS